MGRGPQSPQLLENAADCHLERLFIPQVPKRDLTALPRAFYLFPALSLALAQKLSRSFSKTAARRYPAATGVVHCGCRSRRLPGPPPQGIVRSMAGVSCRRHLRSLSPGHQVSTRVDNNGLDAVWDPSRTSAFTATSLHCGDTCRQHKQTSQREVWPGG